ncbi:hypothetical protein ACTQ34_09380 [Agathobaculum sp. LCP25S3_E8]|uniref:hypothetical protein n=1 Tax=Agathobaculum sp. LCP25S3_E8 TaxID=3438735 RepID=UPI003F8E8183
MTTELQASDTVKEMKTNAGQVDATLSTIKQIPMSSGIHLFSVQKYPDDLLGFAEEIYTIVLRRLHRIF